LQRAAPATLGTTLADAVAVAQGVLHAPTPETAAKADGAPEARPALKEAQSA